MNAQKQNRSASSDRCRSAGCERRKFCYVQRGRLIMAVCLRLPLENAGENWVSSSFVSELYTLSKRRYDAWKFTFKDVTRYPQ